MEQSLTVRKQNNHKPLKTTINSWQAKDGLKSSKNDIHYTGERASADAEAANKYSVKLAKIIKEHDYLPDQIFNADETSLSWKKMPSRTFISKNEKTAPGFKARLQVCLGNDDVCFSNFGELSLRK
uniref:Uncharacterized protein n=1 Tax=Glossina brevipalpis TaxID=37001 RepID=A0A1A9X0N6_9MUSC